MDFIVRFGFYCDTVSYWLNHFHYLVAPLYVPFNLMPLSTHLF